MCARLQLSPSVDSARAGFRSPTARHVVCHCAPSASPPVVGDIEPVHMTDAFFVRQLREDDVPAIADVQCNSFHEPARLFDSALKQMFKVRSCRHIFQYFLTRYFLDFVSSLPWLPVHCPAPWSACGRHHRRCRRGRRRRSGVRCRHMCLQAEVLAGLREKMTVDSGRALLLVAVPRERGVTGSPVAIVEMFLSNTPSVLNAICESGLATEPPSYCALVTSMAVKEDFRRRGCATALLQAVNGSLEDFGTDWSALHVHSDNHSAVALYEQAGYHTLGSPDSSWRKVLGNKERTLMVRMRE